MTWLIWLVATVALFAAASALALYSYGRFAKRARGPRSFAISPDTGPQGALDAAFGMAAPGMTGLATVLDNHEAFALRALTARGAVRSLDMVYYIWRDDMTGRLMARELLIAADRGVRVRLLLDDINAQGFDPSYLGLNGHPNVEVRLFNPIRTRRTQIRRGIELLLGAVRFNRRMHCKAWIADGRVALIGGRNVGNAYFTDDADGMRHFTRDTDLLVAGALVPRLGEMFDAYWNSGLALPISALWHDHRADMPRFRSALDAGAASPRARAYLRRAMRGTDRNRILPPSRLSWSEGARLAWDPPDKALGLETGRWILNQMLPMLERAEQRVALTTPYFVPGRDGVARLAALARRGIDVRVLTNALETTNHLIVHGAYRRYRRSLLEAGVRIHEFAPAAPNGQRPPLLHAKSLTIDGRYGFVGSLNFDLRSAYLNIEMGLIFEDSAIVAELDHAFTRDTAADASHRLELVSGRVRWHVSGARDPRPMIREPRASAWRRGLSWVIGHLPIHAQL